MVCKHDLSNGLCKRFISKIKVLSQNLHQHPSWPENLYNTKSLLSNRIIKLVSHASFFVKQSSVFSILISIVSQSNVFEHAEHKIFQLFENP